MLTDTNRNNKSAYFPDQPLTLANLQSEPQEQVSNDSDVDLSQSKLNKLGIDLSSLHAPESLDQKDEFSDVKTGLQEFNKSIQQYSRKFVDDKSNRLDRFDLSSNVEQFKNKLQELQLEMQSEPPTSDPYKTSIHSIKQLGTTPKQQQSQSLLFQNTYNNQNTSYSSGLSFQPPQLYSTNNKQELIKPDPLGNLSQQLEFHRMKYYDQFMPDNHKLLNNPLRFLKYKIDQQNKYNLEHCLDNLINY